MPNPPNTAAASGWTVWPPAASFFIFEVDGVEIGAFTAVQGLQVEVDVVEYVEGGTNGYVHRLPGRVRWPNVVLRRGITKSDALFDWFKKTIESFGDKTNKLERCTGAITLLDDTAKRLRSWELEGAFPVAWRGPEFNADGDAASREELEIGHHGFRATTFG